MSALVTMRAKWLLAGVMLCVAGGLVIGLSGAGAGSDEAVSEQITIDALTVYRTERSDGERAIYTLEPISEAKKAAVEEAEIDPEPWATTGDLEGCRLLAESAGSVTPDCALMLAMDQRGDLDPVPGPPQVIHSVCGDKPDPGEVAACEGQVVTEAEANESLQALRAELDKR